ncbi:MAG: peptidase S9 family protein [Planctomycetes bacterium]|nr:peptidase S9 family protein [Planctomycetota bacterium]
MRASSNLLLAFALAAAPAAAQDAAPDLAPLGVADVFELEYAADPQISPDGTRIVYERRYFDATSDRVRSNLWMLNADGSDHRPLLTGIANYGSARWSPDGTRIIYSAADEEGRGQLYLRWMDTGQTALLTRFERAPGGVAWSPDGQQIAFTMFVPDAPDSVVRPPKQPNGASWAPAPTVHEDYWYRADGRGFLKPGYSQVFVLPVDGGTPRQLSEGPFHHRGTPQWTPDGEALILSANRRPDWQHHRSDTEIFELQVADGRLRQLTDRRGPDSGPAVSPDGQWIAYTGYPDRERAYQCSKLWVIPRAGGEPVCWSENFDHSVGSLRWAADSQSIFFQYDTQGTTRVASINAAGERQLWAANVGGTSLGRPYTSGSYSVASNGKVAFTWSQPDRPADVGIWVPGGGQRITSLNEDLLGQRALAEVRELRWASQHDELEIQGWLALPPGEDGSRPLPLILEIHGGPAAAYGPQFSTEVQLFAAAGYAVLYCNPRGSTSYGEAFADAIYQAYPGFDYDDLMSGVDLLVERGIADPEQLFVTGGSGGGILSAWIVTRTNRFAAAAIAKPVINWYSFALTSDVGAGFMRRYFPGMPWEAPEAYLARSPIHYVDQVKTPSMLITGEVDWRTPMSESEQFYQALQEVGVETRLVRVPEASHSIARRPSHLIAKVQHVLAWFDRYRAED